MREIVGFYDSVFFWETEMKNNGIILKKGNKKEFVSHKQIKRRRNEREKHTNRISDGTTFSKW